MFFFGTKGVPNACPSFSKEFKTICSNILENMIIFVKILKSFQFNGKALYFFLCKLFLHKSATTKKVDCT